MYSTTITVIGNGINRLAQSDVAIYAFPLIGTVRLFDWKTHYTGYYANNRTEAYLTGRAGGGTPYLYIGGFDSKVNNQYITVTCDNANIGFTSKVFQVVGQDADNTMYDLDGTNLGGVVYGILIANWVFPGGTYNFAFYYGSQVYKLKVVKTF